MRRLLTATFTGLLCASAPLTAWAARADVPAPASHAHAAPEAEADAEATAKRLAPILARARIATAKYATSLETAREDGYTVNVTRMIPDMGWHVMNPEIAGFDASRPSILVYVKRGASWQLVAFEWVFTEEPAEAPLPGATYGSFPAACHYADGTFVPAPAEADCAETSPESGVPFGFWHPDLVTLHLWAWYPNPHGIYAGMNPLVRPFNDRRPERRSGS